VLSSHILHEISDVCERVVIINQGQIVAQDSLESLTRNISDTRRMRLRVEGNAREVYKMIRQVQGVRQVEEMGSKEAGTADFLVVANRDCDVRKPIFQMMANKGNAILMMRPMDIELEDIFLQLTNDKEG